MASPTKLAPKSGFTSPQFYVGLLAVVGTFVLGQFGDQIGLGNLSSTLQKILKDQTNFVVGAIVVALIAGGIALSSWIETRGIKQNGPTKGRPATHEAFYQTSEFWLGLVTVVLSYLDNSNVLKNFGITTDVHAATNTSTLVVALIYTFARSQLKQAYANAQTQGT